MKRELIDIHAHVNFNAFKHDGREVIHRSHDEGVQMILVGSQLDTSRRAIEYAESYADGVWAAIGLHPIHLFQLRVDANEIGGGAPGFATRLENYDEEAYLNLGRSSKVVAIGECGLDYFHLDAEVRAKQLPASDIPEIKVKQEIIFRKQINLARTLKRPLIIHCRNAYEDVLRILRDENADNIGGDIHFFAGDWKIARQFLDLGFSLSFTGVITFTDQYDEVIKKMPLDKIMAETDCPYVAPIPYRGMRNEPRYVREIVKRIAEIRGISFNDAAAATCKNAAKLFHL